MKIDQSGKEEGRIQYEGSKKHSEKNCIKCQPYRTWYRSFSCTMDKRPKIFRMRGERLKEDTIFLLIVEEISFKRTIGLQFG